MQPVNARKGIHCRKKIDTERSSAMRFKALKLIILALVFYAMVRMWHWTIGFTFFTQLSNLFVAVAVFLQLFSGKDRHGAFKYAAVVSVLVTFFVYLLFLAPRMPGGLWAAYRQDHYASLCMHVLVPAAALVDFWLNDRASPMNLGWQLAALLPPIIWYMLIFALSQTGFRWFGMSAPYPFLDYLAPAGWLGINLHPAGQTPIGVGVVYSLIAMLGLFLLVGFLLQKTRIILKK